MRGFELSDYLLTPVYLGLIYGLAYLLRPSFTNRFTARYFLPALTVKLVGALALGVLYHSVYYGDTNNYFHCGSIIYEALSKSPTTWLHLVLSDGTMTADIAPYATRLNWFGPGNNEYFVVRVAAVGSLLGFNTYSVTALFFATFSFSGMWAMYMTFAKIRPQVYKELAVAVFFLPSVFFWGSGILKDSLCLGALGWVFYAFYRGAIEKKNVLRCVIVGLLAVRVIASMKLYILLAFVPPAALWIFNANTAQIKTPLVRWVAKPLFLGVGLAVAVYLMGVIAATDSRLNIEKIGSQSKALSEYIQGVSATEQGSGYNIGLQDGTLGGIVKLAPQAVVVALFRPFIWEARNPTMLLSALEATYFILLTLRIFYRAGLFKGIATVVGSPILTLCFVFSLIFAISVGISSGNFGTLMRYKIPLMPFYLAGLYILQSMTETFVRQGKAHPVVAQRLPARA